MLLMINGQWFRQFQAMRVAVESFVRGGCKNGGMWKKIGKNQKDLID